MMTSYHKTEGWEQALRAWADELLGAPFRWGESDCAIMCAKAFDAMTGSEFAEPLRGSYSSFRSAVRYQRQHDLWHGLLKAGCRALPSPLLMSTGDFVISFKRGLFCGSVCFGEVSLSSTESSGVVLLNTDLLLSAEPLRVLRID